VGNTDKVVLSMITEKMGIQPIHRVCLRGITSPIFAAMVISSVDYPPTKELSGRFDVIVHQVNALEDLVEISRAAKHLEAAGVLWILHPSGDDATPSEMDVRAACLGADLVLRRRCEYSVTHVATGYSRRARVTTGTA
jgi:hypothetical protein